MVNTSFATSPDGTRIAYDRCGAGPVILLLHGGGGSRQDWHQAGYVSRLQDQFTTITLDLRGHGESDLPTDPAAYTPQKLTQDILAVADACGIGQFNLWGMSYGGKVGRYLAVQSQRVTRLVLMGTPLGPGVSGQLRQDAIDFVAYWPPILETLRAGNLSPALLSLNDQEMLTHLNVPVVLAWATAMLEWPAVEPGDLHCPTLWLVGSEDPHAIISVQEYEYSLPDSMVRVHMVQGLNHEQVFEEVDRVLPILINFSLTALQDI